jgi:CheY-like chemotaxis protein
VPKRIFIVDDSKTIRQLGRTYLEARLEPIVCAKATDSLDAIQRASEIGPELILLDFSMPIINGLEGAAGLHGRLPRVPIILFTSHTEIVPEKQAQTVGIRPVVSKTDQIDVLLREVLNFVGVGTAATL